MKSDSFQFDWIRVDGAAREQQQEQQQQQQQQKQKINK